MKNSSISLPVKFEESQDSEGFIIKEPTLLKGIPASFTDATRNDEILAERKGYTVDQNIEITACNYHGEKWLIDESTGDIYDIRRS